MKDSLQRSTQPLHSISEEPHHDTSANDALIASALKKQSSLPLVSTTTYQLSYPNYNQTPSESLEALTSRNAPHADEHEEPVETILLDQYTSPAAYQPAPPVRSFANEQQRFDYLQLNDDNNNHGEFTEQRRREPAYPTTKSHEHGNEEDDDGKARRIRELQSKLTRQEEDSKKQINELQTRQARLENALKLIVKQTAYGKRREQNQHDGDSNVPSLPFIFAPVCFY